MPFLIELFPPAEDGWEIVVYAFVIGGAAGIFAGLLYRAGAVVVLSLAGLLATIIISLSHGWSFGRSILFGFALIAVLQLGYLLGVAGAILRSRRKKADAHQPVIDAASERDTAG